MFFNFVHERFGVPAVDLSTPKEQLCYHFSIQSC